MNIRLHKNATTTPRIRREIQQSNLSASQLAKQYGGTLPTIQHWRHSDSVEDRSHTPHRLQTTRSSAQEVIGIDLRKLLLLSLDDLLVITREFINPAVSCSGLDRCLRRHRVSNLRELKPKPEAVPKKTFKDYEPGFVHIDIKYLPRIPSGAQVADEDHRKYLLVAIGRDTRHVHVVLNSSKSARSARGDWGQVLQSSKFGMVIIQ